MRVHAELREALIQITGKDQYPAYRYQKNTAKQRGIEFKMTFPEWVQQYGGRIAERGISGVVMCRLGDQGGYEAGNVRIGSQRSNVEEYWRAEHVRRHAQDWTFDGLVNDQSDWIESRRDMGYL